MCALCAQVVCLSFKQTEDIFGKIENLVLAFPKGCLQVTTCFFCFLFKKDLGLGYSLWR